MATDMVHDDLVSDLVHVSGLHVGLNGLAFADLLLELLRVHL